MSACSAGDLGLIPGLGRSPGEGNGNPLQYSCLENPMDRKAWWATVHGVAKSRTRLSDFTFTFTHVIEENSLIQVDYCQYFGCERWTIKKAEHQRIDAFKLWCCRRLLRVPWTARRFNQSILKEISPGCSLEGLMLKLKLQYFGHLMQRTDSSEETLMLGKTEGRRRGEQQRVRWLDGITNLMNMSLSKLQEFDDGQGGLVCCSPWGCRVGHD